MAMDAFIKFAGVEGETTQKGFEKQIEVLSFSHGVSNPTSVGAGTGSGKGKAVPGDFHFMHNYDKSSPVIMQKCASGKHFADVVLTARKSGEGQKDFFKITMKEVFITSVQPSGSPHGDIVESVSMSYASIDYSYKPQDDKGGLGGEVKFGWNLKTSVVT